MRKQEHHTTTHERPRHTPHTRTKHNPPTPTGKNTHHHREQPGKAGNRTKGLRPGLVRDQPQD